MEAIEDFYSKNNEKPTVEVFLYDSYNRKIPSERRKLYSSLKKRDSVRFKKLSRLRSYGGKLRNELANNIDVLIALGGSIGVTDLIEKCQQQNKIVVPLNIDLKKPAALNCIDKMNKHSINYRPNDSSDQVISAINKFCLETKEDIEQSIELVLNLIPQLINDKVEDILNIIVRDLKSLQEKNRAVKPDEDKYSLILVELLRRTLRPYNLFPHAQEPAGKTKKGYDDQVIRGGMGELDIRIVDNNNELMHILEAFILKSLNTTVIKEHLDKIFDYDLNGLPFNVIIIYSKTNDFSSLWTKYLGYLAHFNWRSPLINNKVDEISEEIFCPAEIKACLTNHLREKQKCKIYHFFVNLN